MINLHKKTRLMVLSTKETFLDDVKEHSISILQDDGLNRRIRFSHKGSCINHFDIHTWPGHLCITGDCGTYVFARSRDMFSFFRGDDINPAYWAEKCLSCDKDDGIKSFSPELFENAVLEDFNLATEDWNQDKKNELLFKIKNDILSQQECGADLALNAAINFKSDDVDFSQIYEYTLDEFTHRYLWCLHAIVFGIAQYDAIKNNNSKAH